VLAVGFPVGVATAEAGFPAPSATTPLRVTAPGGAAVGVAAVWANAGKAAAIEITTA
jgi:hypothetical protein